VPPSSSLPLPYRFAPLVFFLGLLFLLFAAYLFIRSSINRQALQNMQKQHHVLLDQNRILEGQVSQLQAEHQQKEDIIRLAEKELSLGEARQLAGNLLNAQNQAKEAQNKALSAALELELRKSSSSKEVEVLFDKNQIILRFYESTLFDPGEITLNTQAKKLLSTVGKSLNQDFKACPVRVESHSDNAPIPGGLKSRFPSNWELTAYRAATVARYLQEVVNVDAKRLIPEAKAGNEPVDSNDSREGRARNRRVDLVIPLDDSSPVTPDNPVPSP